MDRDPHGVLMYQNCPSRLRQGDPVGRRSVCHQPLGFTDYRELSLKQEKRVIELVDPAGDD